MSATSGKDRAIPRESVDDRIAKVLNELRRTAEVDLGLHQIGNRADREIGIERGRVRIRFNTNSTHAEGRAIVGIKHGREPWSQREIRVTGATSLQAETDRCRRTLVNMVTRALARDEGEVADWNGAG